MLKARKDNKILLGLSHANLDRLRVDGLKGGIYVRGAEIGIDVDIFITAAPTEADMLHAFTLSDLIGPETKLHIDKRFKS